MTAKRQRTIQGSCWPCKQRRVKCDLARPQCRRCNVSGAQCSFDKILVRWNSRPTKAAPVAYQASSTSPKSTLFRQIQDSRLEASELKALDYFQAALWPLLSTATQHCPPPISLALESEPVLLAMCELAEAHRLLQREVSLTHLQAISNKRLICLSSVRKQLRESVSNNESLSQLLVAVLLLYFLDGFIDCAEQSASTISHQAGVRAIVEKLGGFNMLIDEGQKDTPHMLLSEFASTDLTRAILDDRVPSFPARIWRNIERGTVWWEKQTYGVTLAVVFRTMTQIAFYRQSVQAGDEELSIEKVRDFERCLQPSFSVLRLDHFNCPEEETLSKFEMERLNQTIAFTRAFQHSALIYLYRTICGFSPRHHLVQQHVNFCMGCIKAISSSSKAHNCIVFPVYVVGAHSFTPGHQQDILDTLDSIYLRLRFNSLLSIRAALEDLWSSRRQEGDWRDMFTCLGNHILVL
ncbi:Zn(II)2Cys6 transcription factor [Penicillium maclennaniae]|uniref:Zn(II)2Cys6 transcription factor n=1 Tax=Penicillium maclennaniae TaxID=1343394 RepID=UPI00254146F0|nr:Zn(II)2Cys6 transcription factor [Penicillium maclennaniae]KAJ5678575.1 Zn(II)2Cys6 transcription factor [Penicillium maclennaniae]